MSNDNDVNFLRLQAAQLHSNLGVAVGNEAMSGIAASQARHRLEAMQREAQGADYEIIRLEEENAILKKNQEYYKTLLSKPLYEIAEMNKDFKKTYDVQRGLLAGWMVNQRAFKELAKDLGEKLGMDEEAVMESFREKKKLVLNNETKYDNGIDGMCIEGQPIIKFLKL